MSAFGPGKATPGGSGPQAPLYLLDGDADDQADDQADEMPATDPAPGSQSSTVAPVAPVAPVVAVVQPMAPPVATLPASSVHLHPDVLGALLAFGLGWALGRFWR